jgi:hypothetical protein
LKRKLEYKSIYMSSYVPPNIMIKALQELWQIPLYKSAKISIRPNWQYLVELTNTNECKLRNKKTRHVRISSSWRLHINISSKYFNS